MTKTEILTDAQYLVMALNAAVVAGEKVAEIYNSHNYTVDFKDDDSPVTVADIESDKIISSKLNESQLPILSEESLQQKYDVRKNWETYWCVDPIDGTKDFVARTGNFCICIALIKKRKAHIGVIYLPLTQTVYYGVSGEFAAKAQMTQVIADVAELASVQLPSQPLPEFFTALATSKHSNPATVSYLSEKLAMYPNFSTIRIGSAIKFCFLAEGKAHEYPRFGRMNDWDMAAGHAIIEGAGGEVRSNNGDEILYNNELLYRENFTCRMQ